MTQPYTITQSMIMSAVVAIGTGVVALVPSWALEERAIVTILGGIVTLALPIANAIHVHAAATKTRREAAVMVQGQATVIPTRPSTSSSTKEAPNA